MFSRKADSSSVKVGQKLNSSSNILGKKSTKSSIYKPTKDGQNLFNHQSSSPLEKMSHNRH